MARVVTTVREVEQAPSGRWLTAVDAPTDLADHHRDPGREHFYTLPVPAAPIP